jgi:hypothetical protein
MNIGNSAKVSLPSGAELEMTLAPFLEGEKLFSATAECLKTVKMEGLNTEDLSASFESLKSAVLSCITSKELKEALLACLKRCTYNGQRITSWDIFEDVNAREDYLSVCWEVVKFNLTPFTKSLFSKFSMSLGVAKANPESK